LEGDEEEAPLRSEEVETAIEQVAQQVQAQMHASYVGKGKVCNATFEKYFHTVRDILTAQFVRNALPVGSYFDALHVHLPALSRTTYSDDHRNILEYVTKLSRSQLLVYLRAEMKAEVH
jgi:hypothetical protein